MQDTSRRAFLGGIASGLLLSPTLGKAAELNFPLVDFHVHLNATFSLEQAVVVSKERGVKFGLAQHIGTKENDYPVILSNDRELQEWIATLDGKPVYKGAQGEWIDWAHCFSKDVVAQLDYVLSDAMTIPNAKGVRTKMWLPGFEPGDAQEFMDHYVKWSVKVLESEPLDIMAHPTWLPKPLDQDYDKLWTEERMKPVIDALRRTGTAAEIDAAYNIPNMKFLEMAKAAGVKFSFGSNSGSGPVRAMDFCLETAKKLGLTAKDMFLPATRNRKPIYVRRISA